MPSIRSALATLALAALASTAAPVSAAEDSHIAEAQQILSQARSAEGGARMHQQRAEKQANRAADLRDEALQLRRDARNASPTERDRLEARADEREVQAAIAEAQAHRAERAAARRRADAATLRKAAKARAEEAGRPKAAPKPNGTLSVTTQRACRLSIDGRALGFAPRLDLRLAEGRHRIQCTDLAGKVSKRTIHVTAGTIQRVLVAADARDPFASL